MAQYEADYTRTITFATTRLLTIASSAIQRVPVDESSVLIAITFSAASTESFVNDIVEFYSARSIPFSPEKRWIQTVLFILKKRPRASLKEKLESMSIELSGTTLDWGSAFFQELSLLLELRNAILHNKPDIVEKEVGKTSARTSYHKSLLQRLADRSLIPREEVNSSKLWLDAINRSEVAKWAYKTAVDTIVKIPAWVPDSDERASLERFSLVAVGRDIYPIVASS